MAGWRGAAGTGWLPAALVLVLVSAVAFGLGRRSEPAPLLVFAPASLAEPMAALASAYTAQGGRRVLLNIAGSATLARQIEAGAPADVFISADQSWMDHLQSRGWVRAESRFGLAGNSLVLVAPAGLAGAVDLAAPGALAARLGEQGRLAVADVDTVPAGRYARQALESTGHWHEVGAKLAPSDNVRTALQFVARGEAPLGIVYATDARVDARVVVVARFDPASHAPIVYPVARVATSPGDRADRFLAWLRGPGARAILRRHGLGGP